MFLGGNILGDHEQNIQNRDVVLQLSLLCPCIPGV